MLFYRDCCNIFANEALFELCGYAIMQTGGDGDVEGQREIYSLIRTIVPL
jgi:hypothetical protein